MRFVTVQFLSGPSRHSAHPWRGAARGGCLWLTLLLCAVGIAYYIIESRYPQLLQKIFPQTRPAPPAPPRAVPVGAVKAWRGDLPIYLDAPGTVVALNTVALRTRVDGQIVKVNYTEGQMVRQNDLLVQIDPRPFEVQLAQAQGQLAKDEAALKNARLDLARYQSAGRAATQQQLDTARAAVAQDEGTIVSDKAQIQNAQLQLTYCRITAPISGKIGLRLVDEGNIVHAADTTPLAIINQIEPISVTFSLPEDDLQRVLKASGGEKKLPVELLNRNKTITLTSGTLSAVDSQIDLVTLTAKFKALIDNKEHILFPNQAVNARLLVDLKKNAVLIPAAAVQLSPQTHFVYVVKADDTVTTRPVTPGPSEGETASIERGLAPGEIVVTSGVDKLEPGMKVIMQK